MTTRRIQDKATRNPYPAGPHEWATLLAQTIQRAEKRQDPRLPGLQRAMTEGKAELTLRRLGILSGTDIDREFPDVER